MNPHIYIGGAGTGKTTACFQEIEHILETNPTDQVILLVPDPATYMMERRLAEFRKERGFTTVRVVGITRLTHQVFQSLGKVRQKGISDVGKRLLLRMILKQGGEELDLFKQVGKQPHFADVLQQMIQECKAFEVTPQDLLHGADRVESMVLRRKMEELSHLYSRYEEALDRLDVEDRMETLLDVLPTSPLMKDVHIFVDGFLWFTPIQFRLVQRLFSLSKSCHITVTLPTLDGSIHTRKGAIFARSWETYEELLTWYPQSTIHQLETYHRGTPVLKELGTKFFSFPMKRNSADAALPLVRAYHREREADAVCRRIIHYVQEEGHRFKDCLIILRDMESYGDLLQKACEAYEIPYFSDQRNPMTSHPLAEFLQGLLYCYTTFFDHDAVFRLLKTDFAPVSRLEVDQLENYCLEHGISGAAWLRDSWTYGKEDDEERRQVMNGYRETVMDKLRPFYDFAKEDHTGKEWSQYLFTTMQEWHIPERLYEWSKEAEALGQVEEGQSHLQLYKHTLALLEECMLIGGDEKLSAKDMTLLLSEGLGEATYSLVPPSLDHVVITTIDRSYMIEGKQVFLMGLNEGVFPQSLGDEGIFKDDERQALKQVGITLAAGALQQAFNENFLLYLACTRATEGLHLSYAASDTEGATMEPSLFVQRLQQYHYVNAVEEAPLTMQEGQEERYMYKPSQSLGLLASRISALMKGEVVQPIWWSLYNWAMTNTYKSEAFFATRGVYDTNQVPLIEKDVVRGLLFRGDVLSGSVTRLESYHRCPYSFYARYALHLEPRKVKTFGAPEIGTFLHETLRYLGEYLLEKDLQWRDLSEEEQETLCIEAANSVMGSDEKNAYEDQLYHRLRTTLSSTVSRLVDWSKKSEFVTTGVETNFGMASGGWKPIYIPLGEKQGEAIMLRGQIDRVDEYRGPLGHYVAVIDYKSGGTAIRADEIYYGLKLQLMTYLLALEKNVDPTARTAAAVYTYVKNPQLHVLGVVNHRQAKALKEEEQLKNNGYFIDGDVLQSLDVTRAYQNDSPYVPIKMKKDGMPDSRSLSKLKTTDQFTILKDYTKQIISHSGSKMMEGHFPISPYQKDKKSPCSYCHYRPLCRFEVGKNSYRYISSMAEDRALEMIEDLGKRGDVYEMD